tara:strand:+ start:3531 stop:3830 length:300 start_codon:yes stop_codon:yes gene_type:complete
MPKVCRKNDALTTGHDCVGTTELDTPGQATVYANGILIARKGDSTVAHPIGAPTCPNHTAQVNEGSGSVYVVGKEIARVDDSADLGNMTEGSPDVFAGD